jgi:hypothetical protein
MRVLLVEHEPHRRSSVREHVRLCTDRCRRCRCPGASRKLLNRTTAAVPDALTYPTMAPLHAFQFDRLNG